MQFLVLTHLDLPLDDPVVREGIAAEHAQVRALYGNGALRSIWRRGDRAGAALLFEAESEADVRWQLDTLPLARAGAVTIDSIIPLHPHAAIIGAHP